MGKWSETTAYIIYDVYFSFSTFVNLSSRLKTVALSFFNLNEGGSPVLLVIVCACRYHDWTKCCCCIINPIIITIIFFISLTVCYW